MGRSVNRKGLLSKHSDSKEHLNSKMLSHKILPKCSLTNLFQNALPQNYSKMLSHKTIPKCSPTKLFQTALPKKKRFQNALPQNYSKLIFRKKDSKMLSHKTISKCSPTKLFQNALPQNYSKILFHKTSRHFFEYTKLLTHIAANTTAKIVCLSYKFRTKKINNAKSMNRIGFN